MDPNLMKRLLGGKFPEDGFGWNSVAYFKLEDNDIWEPYGHYDNILPATGFKIKVKPHIPLPNVIRELRNRRFISNNPKDTIK